MDGFPPVEEGQAKDKEELREEEEDDDQHYKYSGSLNDGGETNPQQVRAEEEHDRDVFEDIDFSFLNDLGETNPQEIRAEDQDSHHPTASIFGGLAEETDFGLINNDPNSTGLFNFNFNPADFGICNVDDFGNKNSQQETNMSETEKRRMSSEEETGDSRRKRQCTSMVNQTTDKQQHFFRGCHQITELNRGDQGSTLYESDHQNHFNQPPPGPGMQPEVYLNAAESVQPQHFRGSEITELNRGEQGGGHNQFNQPPPGPGVQQQQDVYLNASDSVQPQHFRGSEIAELNRGEQGSTLYGHNQFNQPPPGPGMQQQQQDVYLNAADSVQPQHSMTSQTSMQNQLPNYPEQGLSGQIPEIPQGGGRIVDWNQNLIYMNLLSRRGQHLRSITSGDEFVEQLRRGAIPDLAQLRAQAAYMALLFRGQQPPLGPPMNAHDQPTRPDQLNQQMHLWQQHHGASQSIPRPQGFNAGQRQYLGGVEFIYQPQGFSVGESLNQGGQRQQHDGSQSIPRPQGFNAGDSSNQGGQRHDRVNANWHQGQGRGGRGRGRDQHNGRGRGF